MENGQIIEARTLCDLMRIVRILGRGILPDSLKCQRVDGWWIATILTVNTTSRVAA